MKNIAAIILAAGSGSRMGRTKQLFRVGGQPLVRRAANVAIEAGCDPVLVVTGSDSQAISDELSGLPVLIEFNPQWSAGMGTSIRSGLSAVLSLNADTAAVILMLCDQPYLNPEILRHLISAYSAGEKPMAACEYAGTFGPPCCFGSVMFDRLLRIGDADGAKNLLLSDPALVTAIPWPRGADDLDTPEDWQRFCQNDSHPPKS